MTTPSRRQELCSARRVVIKIGSRALVDDHNGLDEDRVAGLVAQVAAAAEAGRQIVLVSSGAIAAGLGEMGLAARPVELPDQQAAAATGQARLIGLYRELFARHDLHIGQVLLCHADLRSRQRHLNARNTFSRLLDRGIVPVVNENDAVAVDEIRFGDNDVLSALVAMLVRADMLLMLTTVDGLLAGHPSADSPGDGQVIHEIARIDEQTHALAGGAGSGITVGGMRTKLQAAEMVTRAGEFCVIANAGLPDVVRRVIDGEVVGTLFTPDQPRMRGRKRWIAFFDHPRGDLHVDDGAARALLEHRRSLLAIGITAVAGTFGRGEPVRIVAPDGREIGRGLVNYDAGELGKIRGLPSSRIEQVLGACEYGEVVHRDNLVLK